MLSQLDSTEQASDAGLDRLSQAARFVTHLQLQLAELDRREQQINEQANQFHEQQLVVKRGLKAAQDEVANQRRELQKHAAQLREEEETLHQRVLVLRQQEDTYARRVESLEADRERLNQRAEEDKASFDKECEQIRDSLRIEQQEWKSRQEEQVAEFQREQKLAEEKLAASQQTFLAEQEQLKRVVEAEQAGAWGEVEQHRSKFAAEMERERLQLQVLREELQKTHERERAEWVKQRDAEYFEIAGLKADLQHQRAEQERVNQQWVEHRKEEKRQHLEALEEISRQRLSSLDQREREIQQREIDIQKRFRLHEDHLDLIRRDLAAQKAEMEWREQQQRIWIEQVETSIRMRLDQMKKFRHLLSERERSLQDEQELFHQQRRDTEELFLQQHENLKLERERTSEIREEEKRTLQLQLERLEQEHQQLETQRENVENIVAQLKAAWEKLNNSASAETEAGPVSPLSHVVSILSQQTLELESGRKSLIEQQQQQRAENLRLSEWIEARDAWVRERETLFTQQLLELTTREQACQQEREIWRTERIQVEQLIRGLVEQLETASVPLAQAG